MSQKPTVGRILHYYPSPTDFDFVAYEAPYAAVVVRVVNKNHVNLAVIDGPGGRIHFRAMVYLKEEGQLPDRPYCEWPPRESETAPEAVPESERMVPRHAQGHAQGHTHE